MAIEIITVIRDRARVGEGPFWDDRTGTLSWVDILGGRINSLTGDLHTRWDSDTLVGAAIPKCSGGFVAATREGFADIDADGALRTRLSFLPDGQRMNDAKCDPAGRLWAGSTDIDFAAGVGELHVLSTDWQCETVLSGLTLPNGLGWSPDGRTFYLIDSIAREVYAFDVTPEHHRPTNRRVLKAFSDRDGLPDGMAVDAQGGLWIAMWGGARVIRLSPDGDLLAEIAMPVAQPSSCVFGGPGLDVLYVTTAREGLELAEDDLDGSVLAVRGLDVSGLSNHIFGG